MNRLKTFTKADVGEVALDLITFLAEDEERFSQFLGLSGLSQSDVTQNLAEPHFQAMVLDQVLQDQSLVLEFASSRGLRPEALLMARHKLPGAESA